MLFNILCKECYEKVHLSNHHCMLLYIQVLKRNRTQSKKQETKTHKNTLFFVGDTRLAY